MNKKRILSIALFAGMLLAVLAFAASCAEEEETITVHVKIVGLEDDVLCDKEVVVTGRDLSVKDALQQACVDMGETLRFSGDGTKPVQIGDYIDLDYTGAISYDDDEDEADEDDDGETSDEPEEDADTINEDMLWFWAYTLNGEEAAGSSVQKISEGDVIVWSWTKYELVE